MIGRDPSGRGQWYRMQPLLRLTQSVNAVLQSYQPVCYDHRNYVSLASFVATGTATHCYYPYLLLPQDALTSSTKIFPNECSSWRLKRAGPTTMTSIDGDKEMVTLPQAVPVPLLLLHGPFGNSVYLWYDQIVPRLISVLWLAPVSDSL
jgi:hypothetical protein